MFYNKKDLVVIPAQNLAIYDLPNAAEFSIDLKGVVYVLHQVYNQGTTSYRYVFRRADGSAGFAIVSPMSATSVSIDVFSPATHRYTAMNADKHMFGENCVIRSCGIFYKVPSSIAKAANAKPVSAGDTLIKEGEHYATVVLARDDALIIDDAKGKTAIIGKNNECLLNALGLAFIEE